MNQKIIYTLCCFYVCGFSFFIMKISRDFPQRTAEVQIHKKEHSVRNDSLGKTNNKDSK